MNPPETNDNDFVVLYSQVIRRVMIRSRKMWKPWNEVLKLSCRSEIPVFLCCEISVKFQQNHTTLKPYLAASRFHGNTSCPLLNRDPDSWHPGNSLAISRLHKTRFSKFATQCIPTHISNQLLSQWLTLPGSIIGQHMLNLLPYQSFNRDMLRTYPTLHLTSLLRQRVVKISYCDRPNTDD